MTETEQKIKKQLENAAADGKQKVLEAQRAARRQLEETLRRAAVACYAAQGAYPPDLDYIEEHWGVQIDRSRYAVFYQVEGSNLMPDITVLERET